MATCTGDSLEGKNWCKACEYLVHIASTIGELQHTGYCKLAVILLNRRSLVFPDYVRYKYIYYMRSYYMVTCCCMCENVIAIGKKFNNFTKMIANLQGVHD